MELLKGEMQHLKKETGKQSVPCFLILASSSSSLITVGDLRIPHHILKYLCVTAVYQEPSWVQMKTKEGAVQFQLFMHIYGIPQFKLTSVSGLNLTKLKL